MKTNAKMNKKKLIDILNFVGLSVVALLFLFPFFWMISNALKTNAEVLAVPVRLVPEEWHWENFYYALTELPFARFFMNSLFISVSVTFLTITVSCLSGYAFARLRFPGRESILMVFLSTMMVPGMMMIIPLFLMINKFGMVNTYMGAILPMAFGSFGAFLMRQFFRSIPAELEEAARIDGASRLRVLLTIIMPLAMPAIGLLALFTFIGQWNNFLWPLIVLTKSEMTTLPVGLTQFRGQAATDWNYIMAGATISMIPGVILAIGLQKMIYKSISLNAGMGGR